MANLRVLMKIQILMLLLSIYENVCVTSDFYHNAILVPLHVTLKQNTSFQKLLLQCFIIVFLFKFLLD